MQRISKILKPLWAMLLLGLVLVALLIKGQGLGMMDIRSSLLSDHLLGSTIIIGDAFPKTLIDPTGEKYLLNTPPKRIVSATLGTDEMLAAFDMTRKIVGVTYFVDQEGVSSVPNYYPKSIQRVNGDIEEILALQPDLAFVAGYTRAETVRLLMGAGIPVVRLTHYDSFEDIERNILSVAAVTGSEERANELIKSLNHKISFTQKKVNNLPRPRVLYYNLSGYSAGEGTLMDETIQVAGGYNVLRDIGIQGNPKISEEIAIALEPDVILLTGGLFNDASSPVDILMKKPAWKNVPAVINHRVYPLTGAWILSVSQFSWEGLEKVTALIHPEVFK